MEQAWTLSSPERGDDVNPYENNEEDSPTRQQQQQHQSTVLLQDRKPRWKPVIIELTSPRPLPGGKTNLLYYITALAVLPTISGGQGTAVIWLDTDGRFSATRLRQVMLGVISTSSTEENNNRERLVLEALTHVHVFRPQCSLQLIATLDSLPSYLLNATASSSIHRRLGLIVLDSATAFYWQDRFYAETARFEHSDELQARPSRTAEVITRLKRMQKGFDCAILFSTTTNSSISSPSAEYRRVPTAAVEENAAPHEPRSIGPWTAFASFTLRLSRVKVPHFAEHMSLEECLRDRDRRQEAVAKGRFMVGVDHGGIENWTSETKDRLRRQEREGMFQLDIGETVSVWRSL